MSHDRDHSHSHSHSHDPAGDSNHLAGGQDTRFLDLEISRVLFDEAESITRTAFRELLQDAAKRHWQAHYGERIDALAALAVTEMIADIAANQRVEATIADRNQARQDLDARVRAILAGPTEPASE